MRLTKFGKIVEGSSAAGIFLAGLSVVGSNDYQSLVDKSASGATIQMWAVFAISNLLFWYIQWLKKA